MEARRERLEVLRGASKDAVQNVKFVGKTGGKPAVRTVDFR
jgi:hypothetical protein